MKKKGSPGFTLIEVVVAFAVLSIAVGSLLAVMSGVMSSSVYPEVLNTGVFLAERELERVSGLRYAQLSASGPANFPAPFSDYSYRIAVSAVPASLAADPGMADYKQVEIIVSHPDGGSVKLTTVRTNC